MQGKIIMTVCMKSEIHSSTLFSSPLFNPCIPPYLVLILNPKRHAMQTQSNPPSKESHDFVPCPLFLFPLQSNTLLFPKSLAFFHLQYSVTTSFNTTNKHPPTKLLPHFSFSNPPRPPILTPRPRPTHFAGSETWSNSPMAAATAGKNSAPIMVSAERVAETFCWNSRPLGQLFCWGLALAFPLALALLLPAASAGPAAGWGFSPACPA